MGSILQVAEDMLKEFEGKLDQETRSKIQAAIDRLKEAVKTNNATELKSAIDQYNTVWNEASSKMYSQAKSQPGAEQGPNPNAGQQASGEPKKDDGNVENADFEVVDDKK